MKISTNKHQEKYSEQFQEDQQQQQQQAQLLEKEQFVNQKKVFQKQQQKQKQFEEENEKWQQKILERKYVKIQQKRQLISSPIETHSTTLKRACLNGVSKSTEYDTDENENNHDDEEEDEDVQIDVDDDQSTFSERQKNNVSRESSLSLPVNVEDCLKREFTEGEQNITLNSLEKNSETTVEHISGTESTPTVLTNKNQYEKEGAEFDLKKYYFLEQLKSQSQNMSELDPKSNSPLAAAAAAMQFQLMSQVLSKISTQDNGATGNRLTSADTRGGYNGSVISGPDSRATDLQRESFVDAGSVKNLSTATSLTDSTARAIAASTFASFQQAGNELEGENPFANFSSHAPTNGSDAGSNRSQMTDVSSFLAAANYLNSSGNLFLSPSSLSGGVIPNSNNQQLKSHHNSSSGGSSIYNSVQTKQHDLSVSVSVNNSHNNNNNNNTNNSNSLSAFAEKRGRGRPPKYGTLFQPGTPTLSSNPVQLNLTNGSSSGETKLKISSSSSSSSQSSSPALSGHAAAASALQALANTNTRVSVNTNRSRRGRPPSVPDENFRSVSSGRIDKPHHKCSYCPQVYYGYHAMRDHITSVHLNSGEKYTCHLCNKEYTWRITLRKHLKCQHGVHPDHVIAKNR